MTARQVGMMTAHGVNNTIAKIMKKIGITLGKISYEAIEEVLPAILMNGLRTLGYL